MDFKHRFEGRTSTLPATGIVGAELSRPVPKTESILKSSAQSLLKDWSKHPEIAVYSLQESQADFNRQLRQRKPLSNKNFVETINQQRALSRTKEPLKKPLLLSLSPGSATNRCVPRTLKGQLTNKPALRRLMPNSPESERWLANKLTQKKFAPQLRSAGMLKHPIKLL